MNSAFLLARSSPGAEGKVALVETSSTPLQAQCGCGGTGNVELCLEPRVPEHGVCCW